MDASIATRLAAMSEQKAQSGPGPSGPGTLEADLSDEALMIAIAAGSKEALAILFRRYARLVRALAIRILNDTSEADDLLQDVFLFINDKSGMFESSKSSARSWIVQMTYHRAIDRRRYLQSRQFYTRVDLHEATDIMGQSHEIGRSSAAVYGLFGSLTIDAFLKTLTEDQRNTLSLHFVEGYTFKEIAGKLGQSVRNIRNHYYRGLDKLRKQMFSGKLRTGKGGGKQ